MRLSFSSSSRLSLALMALSLLAFSLLALMPKACTSVKIKPDPAGNEHLFLTYVLHDLYDSLPADMSSPQALQEQLADLRHRATRFHEYIKARHFDPKLASLYADCLSAVDAYTSFLADMGRIEREAVARLENERAGTGFRAGFTAGSAAVGAYNEGSSGGDAALTGLALGAIQWFMDDYNKGRIRDEAKRAAIEAAGQKLEGVLSAITARLENTESELAAQFGWKACEVRSSDPQSEAKLLAELTREGNTAGVLQIIDKKIARRPHDAVSLASRDYMASFNADVTVPEMVASAERCATRASLVPAGKIYDFYRAQIFYLAADTAQRAWTKGLSGHELGTAKSPTAAYATELWGTVLEYCPNDEDGECRERRAWALMASGRLREAVAQADEVSKLRGNTLRYVMNYARLMNAIGNTSRAFEWFQYAVKTLGFNDVAQAKADPDLAAMRRANVEAFDNLMAVKFSWDIQWGLLNDDIVVTNNSAFPITNVTLSCRIESGGKVWTPELKCKVIKPGETYKWVDVISIPGSRMDSSNATLFCDQNK